MRKPMERVNGKWIDKLEGLDEFVEKVADELCSKYPEIDILDLESMFNHSFGYEMMLCLMRENAK